MLRSGWSFQAGMYLLEGVSALTANQYRAALDKLGLTQAGAAEFLGVSIRTSHGYANGEPIPEGYAKFLRLMVRLNLKPEDVK